MYLRVMHQRSGMRDPRLEPFIGDVLYYNSEQLVGPTNLWLWVMGVKVITGMDGDPETIVECLVYDDTDTWLDFFLDSRWPEGLPEDDEGYMMSFEITLESFRFLVEDFIVVPRR